MRNQGRTAARRAETPDTFRHRFESLVDCSIQGIVVHRNNRVVFANATAADMFGFRKASQLVGQHPMRFVAPEDRARVQGYGALRRAGKSAPERYEFRGNHRRRADMWVEARVTLTPWDGVPSILVTVVDITERKRAEQALLESEERFRNLVEGSVEGINVLQGRELVFVNQAFADMFGYRNPAHVLRHPVWERFQAPEERRRMARNARNRFHGRPAPPRYTFKGLRRDGKEIWLEASVRRILWHGAPALQGTLIDITERKQAEEALAASRGLLRTVVDTMPQALFAKDKAGRYLLANRGLSRFHGLEPHHVIGRTDAELPGTNLRQAAAIRRADRQVMRTGQAVNVPAAEMADHTGRVHWLAQHRLPLRDASGAVIGVVGVSQDVTARRKAEADLVASKQLLEQILANIPVGLSLVDKDLNVIATNERFHDLLGFPKRLRGRVRPFSDYVRYNAERGEYGPGEVDLLVKERVALARKFRPHRFERVRPGGPAVEITGNPLPGGGFITTYVDITERRAAQDSLLASQRLLRTVLDSLPHFLTVKDDRSRYTLVNRTFAAFWGRQPADFLGRRPDQLKFLPAAYARMIDDSDRLVLQGQTVDRVGRQYELKGQLMHQRVVKVPVKNPDGTVEGVVALVEDVTEQRKADEALRASQRLLKLVFDLIPSNLFVKDLQSRFVMANRAQCAFNGMTEEQFQGLRTEQLLGREPELLKRTLAQERQVLKEGMVVAVPEYQRANTEGSVRWLRGVKLPLMDDNGKVIGLLGMTEDVTEARQAQEALEYSRRLLRTAIDAIPVNLFVKDMEGRFVMVNRSQADLYGLRPEEMIGKTAATMAGRTPETLAEIDGWDRRVLEAGATEEVPEMVRLDHRGQPRILRGIKTPLRDAQGRVAGLVGMTQDITAERHAADALEQSERRMRVLLDNAPIIIYSVDRDGVFTTSEGKELGTAGRMPGQVVGKSAFEVFAHLPERVAQLRRGLAGEAFSEETQVDGQWFDTRHEPVRDATGTVTGLVVVSTNVTQRHLAEEAAKAGRRLLQAVFDTIPHSLWVKDTQGRFVMVNHAQARFYGLTPEQMAGMHQNDVPGVTPELVAKAWAEDQRAIAENRMVEAPLAAVPRLDKQTGWFRRIKLPLRDEHGTVVGVVGLAEDITERQRAAEALDASQRLLQALFDTIPHRLWVKDTANRYLLVNHAQARFHGLAPSQMVGMHTRDLPALPAKLTAQLVAQDQRVLEGEVVDDPEFPFPTADGAPGWVRIIKLPLRNEAGAVIGAVGLAEDITERKRAELEARAARRLLQTVFDTVPHDLTVKDAQGTFIMVNHATARFHGLTPQAMVGMPTHRLPNLTDAQREALARADRAAMEKGERVDTPPLRLCNAEGEDQWIHSITYPLRDDDGKVIGVVGVGENVTERKRYEEELWTSRELLRTVFHTLPTLLNVKDRNSRYLMVNAASARFEGLTPEQFQALPTESLPNRSPEQIREILAVDRRILETGQPEDVGEYRRLNGAGEQRWLHGRKFPLRDERGDVTGLVSVIEDITEYKQALEQVQASRHLLQTIFDAIPLRISVRDVHGRYVTVNRRISEDHQRPVSAFIGQEIWTEEGVPEAEREQILSRVRQALRTGKAVETPEISILLPGKNRRLIRSTLVPLFDGHGALQGVLGIGEDITERKRSEQALLQAQKLESLGVLAGGVAHDFNNLLVTIMGNASLAVLKLPPNAGPLEELQQIEMAGQRAADLCRQMLSYAGKGRLEKQPVNLNHLVQEMMQLLRVSLPKGVAVNFHLMPDLPLTEADATQLRQVVMNLVINAGEAIGERPGTIIVSTGITHVDRDYLADAQTDQDAPEGDYVFLEVSDTGVGMDPQTRARIFDPFFTTKFTGRGLGLASVLGIVRGHQGGLKVYSEPGKGTSFKVLLPFAEGTGPVASREDPEGEWSGGGTVLVIDDEQSIRSVAVRMLSRLGFSALEAADGTAALDLLRNAPTPLTAALLDLTMPGLSGDETLRQLRRIDDKLPVILMSGYNEQEVLDRFVGRGLAGFLQKPFKLDDLRDKLRKLFETRTDPGRTPSA